MPLIRYNSLKNKTPAGAVEKGKEINLEISADSSLSPLGMKFILNNNYGKTILTENMFFTPGNNCSVYSVSFTTPETGIYFYHFVLKTPKGEHPIYKDGYEAKISDDIVPWQLTVYEKDSSCDYLAGSVMYQIFPDRFCRKKDALKLVAKNETERTLHANWDEIPNSAIDTEFYTAKDFFMGNIEGIIQKLDYIASLGVNIIYLNPIFESAENHRYSTADYKNIDPYLGTIEDFKKLKSECKKRNIMIILDGVFSHSGADSIYFNKYGRYNSVGAYQDINSKYYPWYNFIEFPNKYKSWWGFDNLPDFNKDNPDYENFITDTESGILAYWQDLGVDGWRLDVADEFPDHFLDSIRRTVKQKNPNAFIIGEVWEDATTKMSYNKRRRYLLGKQLDSVMNYPWKNAIIKFIKDRNAEDFAYQLNTIKENYPPSALRLLMNSLSTHDTVRILNILGITHTVDNDKKPYYTLTDEEISRAVFLEKFAAFLQFTLPGIPCIYYGDEVGLDGFQDPFNRKTYPYGKENMELLDFYINLSKIRLKYKLEFSGEFNIIYAKKSTLVFNRNNLICTINMDDQPTYISLPLKGKNVYGASDTVISNLGIILPALSFNIIEKEKNNA